MFITKKYILVFLFCLIIISLPLVILAAVNNSNKPNPLNELEKVGPKAGYKLVTEGTALDFIAHIINFLLGLLGVIAVIIVIIGGFKWMTAGGNDEKIGEAKKLIGQGIIGLIIVLAAYAIAHFIISKLQGEFIESKNVYFFESKSVYFFA